VHLDSDIKTFVKDVYIGCGILCVAEIAVCMIVSMTGFFDFTIGMTLGAIGGTLVSMICFLWMAFSLQRSLDKAQNGATPINKGVQSGYGKRLALQGVWILVCIFSGIVNPICGLIPLLFPKAAIYMAQMTGRLELTKKAS